MLIYEYLCNFPLQRQKFSNLFYIGSIKDKIRDTEITAVTGYFNSEEYLISYGTKQERLIKF
jgi:hypothetical protein